MARLRDTYAQSYQGPYASFGRKSPRCALVQPYYAKGQLKAVGAHSLN